MALLAELVVLVGLAELVVLVVLAELVVLAVLALLLINSKQHGKLKILSDLKMFIE